MERLLCVYGPLMRSSAPSAAIMHAARAAKQVAVILMAFILALEMPPLR